MKTRFFSYITLALAAFVLVSCGDDPRDVGDNTLVRRQSRSTEHPLNQRLHDEVIGQVQLEIMMNMEHTLNMDYMCRQKMDLRSD